ncbi:MAG: carbohydrate ABC transporter permease, partial [Syntrophothermus sp.]
ATSLGLAIAVNRQLKGISFFRTALYMPTVTSTVAISIVWIWLYNPSFGLINWFLGSLGVANPPHWLETTFWAKPAMIVMTVWQECGYYMIIFLAGLQTIPDHLYEAADIDGASVWQKFWRITLPLLSPTTFLVTVMKTIYAFQIFEQVYVMTQGKPAGTTETIVYFIYMNGFRWFKMGYAAAAAWILFVIIFTLTLIQFRFQKNWVHYE